MVRKPVFAGRFYPNDPSELKRSIKELFHHELGPGNLPSGSPGKSRTILGVMVPHAGYPYSGAIAAHGYYTLFEDGMPETLILIGPSHSGMGTPVSVYPEGAWKTPLGEVNIDEDVVASLVENEVFQGGKVAHRHEHSLEVQLPFLQFIFPRREFKIVPIACRDQRRETMKQVAEGIIASIETTGKDLSVIASTDLSHYIPYKKAKEEDENALRAIEELEVDQLYGMVKEGYSMCGYGPVSALMYCARHYNAIGGTLQYATSGDVTGDKTQVVGYAALAFTEVKPQRQRKKEKVREKAVPA